MDETTDSFACLPQIVIAGEFVVKAGWELGPRKLGEYELVYFPQGSFTIYHLNGVKYPLDKPCFILTRPEEEHMYSFSLNQPTRHLFIRFTWNNTKNIKLFSDHPLLTFTKEVSLVPLMLKQILYLASTIPIHWKERCTYLLQTVFMELEGHVMSKEVKKETNTFPTKIINALIYIDKHLHEDFTVIEVAKHVEWSHEYFTRMFVQHVGMSPKKIILQKRIERASQLLVQSQNKSIKEIAYTVGFQDEHYFSRIFVKMKGMTASQFRQDYSDPRVQHLVPVDEYGTKYSINHYYVFSFE